MLLTRLPESHSAERTTSLSVDQQSRALHGISGLVRAAKPSSTYSAQSAITQSSFAAAHSRLKGVLEQTGALSFCFTGNGFMLNGRELPGTTAPLELEMLERHRLSGLMLRPSLSLQELMALAGILAARISAEKNWSDLLREHQIGLVVVNETVFVGVAEENCRSDAGCVKPKTIIVPGAISQRPGDPLHRLDGNVAGLGKSGSVKLAARLDAIRGLLEELRREQQGRRASEQANGRKPRRCQDRNRPRWAMPGKSWHGGMRQRHSPASSRWSARWINRCSPTSKAALKCFWTTSIMRMRHPGARLPRWPCIAKAPVCGAAIHYLASRDHPRPLHCALSPQAARSRSGDDPARHALEASRPEEVVRLLQAMEQGGLWTDVVIVLLGSPVSRD